MPNPPISEGDLVWTPSAERVARSNLVAYMRWLEAQRGLHFADYHALYRWSIDELEAFWRSIWDYYGVRSSTPVGPTLTKRTMPGTDWFPGVRLNYAEHVLRNEVPGETALVYLREGAKAQSLDWSELGAEVRALATRLRELGIKPGDRVAAYLPNSPQAVIAMLATTSIGAIWASVSPDFGSRGVLDRLHQLGPKGLFCVDGYRYGGKEFDRRAELRGIVAGLESLEHVIYLPYLNPLDRDPPSVNALYWDDLTNGPALPAADFKFEQVPFRHPLWILFSSGTTGLPKAIVHGHGGILLEQLKLVGLHMDLHPRERLFFFTTTGWMMWNFLVSSMLCKVVPVLYDGNPAHPDPDALWRMVEETRTTFFGSSPTYVDIMRKQGIVPKNKFDLTSLQTVMPAGSPVTAECNVWFYDNVKSDLWVATGSGGTDFCTGCVGSVPTLPVYAGEIQAPSLGIAAKAYDDHGHGIVGQVGELVITEPMPSMPLHFWNDAEDRRYLASYFREYPGVWRHGDFFRINARGGCFVLGRSDSTLNRFGVRIGTAEVYRVLATLPEIVDSLIVNLDLPGGKFFMPLFVKLASGVELDATLTAKINACLREQYTPRHVPDRIYRVDDIPVTLSGKKMEVPVRKILLGVPVEKAANPHTMPNPRSLDFFVDYARTQRDYSLTAN